MPESKDPTTTTRLIRKIPTDPGELARAFVGALSKALRSIELYPSQHRVVQESTKDWRAVFEAAVGMDEELPLHLRNDVFLVRDRSVDESSPTTKSLVKYLQALRIDLVSFSRDSQIEDLVEFFAWLVERQRATPASEEELSPDPLAPWTQRIRVRSSRLAPAADPEVLQKAVQLIDGWFSNLADHVSHGKEGTFAQELPKELFDHPGQIHKTIDEVSADVCKKQSLPLEKYPEVHRTVVSRVMETLKQDSRPQAAKLMSQLFLSPTAGKPSAALAGAGPPRAPLDLVEEMPVGDRAMVLHSALMTQRMDSPQAQSLVSKAVQLNPATAQVVDSLFERLLKAEASGHLKADVWRNAVQSIERLGDKKSKARKGKVALAESDSAVLAEWKQGFEEAGWTVFPCSDGQQTFDCWKTQKPDLLVLQPALAKIHGLELLARVLRDRDVQRIPVLLVGDDPRMAKSFEFQSYPKRRFLGKPIPWETLLREAQAQLPPSPEEKTEAEKEIERARTVQKGLLPGTIPQMAGLEIDAIYEPSRGVSGDYYDFMLLGKDRLGIAVADVSGKGLPASLMMVMTRSYFRIAAQQSETPRAALVRTNDFLCANMRKGTFVTFLYMIYDSARKSVTLCSAGHQPPILYRDAKTSWDYYAPKSFALGIRPKPGFEQSLSEAEVRLGPGDMLFAFTDGVNEAMNPSKQLFGMQRLQEVLCRAGSKSAREILKEVQTSVEAHRGTAEQTDDITAIVLKPQ